MAYSNAGTSGYLNTSSAATLSWTHTPSQNNLMTCRQWSGFTAIGTTDVHDSSGTPVNFSRDVTNNISGATSDTVSIWSLLVPAGYTSPCKNDASYSWKSIVFDEWSGNATSSILDTSNSAVSTGDTGSINSGANAGLFLCVIDDDPNGSAAPSGISPASWTQDVGGPPGLTGAAATRTTNTASQTGAKASWSSFNNPCVACIASYNVSGGGGGGTPVIPPMRTLRGAGL